MSTPRDHTSLWAGPQRGTRQPRFTRDQVAAAALQLVDDEGFAGLSMRRLAQRLGAGTMTLYHYVRTKQDLVALMDDHLMAEILVPADEFPEGWRAAFTLIARKSFAAFRAHPWALLPRAHDEHGFGPNGMRHFEQSLQATRELDLPTSDRMSVITLVDDYVWGAALSANQDHGTGDVERSLDQWRGNGFLAFAQQELESGAYPEMSAVLGDDVEAGMRAIFEQVGDVDGFENGLVTVLDGIEARYVRGQG
ncbi:MAG: Transcriptional regulator, TetR family protein [Thermoleophilia bacterium]|nr:Transcriptional regulator, TetR family protein [Thermoleophilia bacterium]